MLQAETTFQTGAAPHKPHFGWRRALIAGAIVILTGAGGWWIYQTQRLAGPLGQNTAEVTTTTTEQTTSNPLQESAAVDGQQVSAAATAIVEATPAGIAVTGSAAVSIPAIAGVQGIQLWSDDGSLLAALPSGSILEATARTAEAAWLAVQSEAGAGWVQAAQLIAFDVKSLAEATLPAPVLAAANPQSVSESAGDATQPVAPVEETSAMLATIQGGSATEPTAAGEATASLAAAGTGEPAGLTATVSTSGDRLNVRSGPGTDYAIVDSVDDGELLIVLGSNDAGEWLQVELPDASGGFGWVSASYVQFTGQIT